MYNDQFSYFNPYTYLNDDHFHCKNCSIDGDEHLVEGPAFWTCDNCGACYDHVVEASGCVYMDEDIPGVSYYTKQKKRKDGSVIKAKISYGLQQKRRYKRIFHYKERLAQWNCTEPKIVDKTILPRFEKALESGRYGSAKFLSHGHIMQMCKDLRLCRYKENWKTILYFLNRKQPPLPEVELERACIRIFKLINRAFPFVVEQRLLKGGRGKTRHNICHLNYTHRKILEAMGNSDWHREFPLLRTPSKIHALDDAMEIIMKQNSLPFTRTAVVAIPKMRTKRRKCFSVS